jgi:hypothetical protein
VSADSSSDAWAISGGGYVLHWQGGRWSVAKTLREHGEPVPLTGVTALSPGDVWVFAGAGNGALVARDAGARESGGTWHLSGTKWNHVTGLGGDITIASAVSSANIWAIAAGNLTPDTLIARYTGGRWRQVTARALAGKQFQAITALADGQVWVAAQTNASHAYLIHLTSRDRWVTEKLPWPVALINISPDGQGGVWLTASSNSGQYLIHRTASGRWHRTLIAPDAGDIIAISQVGNNSSLWGAGAAGPEPGASAAVWAYGRAG